MMRISYAVKKRLDKDDVILHCNMHICGDANIHEVSE